jgi:hypothetical protein
MTEEPPMSGAEFQRNVHDDVDSWADRMVEDGLRQGMVLHRQGGTAFCDRDAAREWLRGWIQDAMDAARKAKPKPVVE